ncbi:MAG: FIST N-terminal domain-containing protein [bacterium]
MHVEQLQFATGKWAEAGGGNADPASIQLVLAFGDRDLLQSAAPYSYLRARYPDAAIVSCSSGGDVLGAHVEDGGIVATAVGFAHARVQAVEERLHDSAESERAGIALVHRLKKDGLRHVLIFAEGLRVNGSALARGVAGALPAGVPVTGGLAADGEDFGRTAVGLDGTATEGRVVAVGLYGDSLDIGIGSYGGWQPFGQERVITRSRGNELLELDGRPALDLYKELLGPLGYALPASGLLFPLRVRESTGRQGVVRTILGVDVAARSVTFAGDVPEGWLARLMRTDLDTLIRAAGSAADRSIMVDASGSPSLVLAVSCIGRKLLLQQRVHEELALVGQRFGSSARMAGFYSYGELAPSEHGAPCELHNQTMTLTTLRERP